MSRDVQLQVTPRTVWTVGLHVLGVVLLWRGVGRMGPVLGLVGLALLLALAAEPLVRWLSRRGLPRGVGVAAVSLLGLGLLGLMVGTLVPMLIQQLKALIGAVPKLLDRLMDAAWVQRLEADYGLGAQLRQDLSRRTSDLLNPLVDVVQGAVSAVAAFVAVLVLVIFMLIFGPSLYRSFVNQLPSPRRGQVDHYVGPVLEAVTGYIGGSALIACVGSVLIGAVLALLGVPYFLPLALSYLVLGLIPWIGSALTAIMVTLTTLAALGWQRALVALVFFLVYQQIEGNILQPLIQRRTLNMNPLAISLLLLLGGGVGGLLGMVLTLPIAAAVMVVLQRRQQDRDSTPPSPTGGDGETMPSEVREAPGQPASEAPATRRLQED